MDVKHTMLPTLLLMSCAMYCHSLSAIVAVSSPDLETTNTPTHETGQKHVPGSFWQGRMSEDERLAVSSAWLNDVRLTFKRRAHLWKGNIITDQSKKYLELVQDPVLKISTVCETGFFLGVSTHLWLWANPNMAVHSFDLNFDQNSLEDLTIRFPKPGHLFTYKGDSNLTIPNLPEAVVCDLISVDGSHDGWQPLYDFLLLSSHARCNHFSSSPTYVVFDDTFALPERFGDRDPATLQVDNNPDSRNWFNWCSRSYWYAVSRGFIQHVDCTLFSEKDGPYPKGFCMGTVKCPDLQN